jgi:hypothetical protein
MSSMAKQGKSGVGKRVKDAKPKASPAESSDGWARYDSLKRWEKNPRLNDASAVRVAASIEHFGFVAPIVVWPGGGRIVAGDTRLKAMRLLMEKDATFTAKGAPGPGMVRVVFHEFESEEDAVAYGLADNKLNEVADWDDVLLSELALHLGDADVLGVAGFSSDEIAAIVDTPTFTASGLDDQGKLDVITKQTHTCPSCGTTFT